MNPAVVIGQISSPDAMAVVGADVTTRTVSTAELEVNTLRSYVSVALCLMMMTPPFVVNNVLAFVAESSAMVTVELDIAVTGAPAE
jgi:hypothetical protein